MLGPRQCRGPQLFEIYAGILAGGVQVAVSEKVGYGFQSDAMLVQPGGERMPEQMRSPSLDPASRVGTADSASQSQNGYGAAHRQVMTKENVLSGRFRTAVL